MYRGKENLYLKRERTKKGRRENERLIRDLRQNKNQTEQREYKGVLVETSLNQTKGKAEEEYRPL